jgi:tRNA A-37 threonylcarbamoyl transferase component Bud32
VETLLRRGPVSETWRLEGRFEKRYAVLWPWLPLAGLLKMNVPALDARVEARNAERLRALGVEAPRPLATTSRWRLAPLGLVHETTVALEPLEGTSLDALLRDGKTTRGERLAIARALGEAVRCMHRASIFHRDLYLCHLLWDGRRIGVLDVARASPRRWRRERWRVKDLAALSVSAEHVTRAEIITFLRAYMDDKETMDRALLARVARKAASLARHGRKS